MKRMDDLEKRFMIAAVCFSLISIAVLLLPLCDTEQTAWQEILGVAIGVLFWGGITAGSLSYFLIYRTYRERLEQEKLQSKVPAFLRFFSNPIAVGVDIVLILSLAGVIYCIMAFHANEVLDFISLFLFVTSLYLHCMVNGKIFQYIAQKKKRGVQDK